MALQEKILYQRNIRKEEMEDSGSSHITALVIAAINTKPASCTAHCQQSSVTHRNTCTAKCQLYPFSKNTLYDASQVGVY